MVRVALVSTMCLGALGEDSASLLQANTGKKTMRAVSSHQLLDEFVRAPDETVARVASMHPAEQLSLLHQFVSADAPSLVKELEPNHVGLALALRQSTLPSVAKGTPSEWISALQHHAGEVESSVSRKGKSAGDAETAVKTKGGDKFREANDNATATEFDDSIFVKDTNFTREGGRCRTGSEFADYLTADFAAACSELCDLNEICVDHEVEQVGNDTLCKRFNVVEVQNTRAECEALCSENTWCTGFEHDGSACEIFENATQFVAVDGEANTTAEVGCFEATRSAENPTTYTKLGDFCRTGTELEDLDEEATCQALCDEDEVCDSSDYEAQGDTMVCKRHLDTLKTYRGEKTLRACAKKCAKWGKCEAFEWDNGECELHTDSANATLTSAEAVGDDHACYFKSE